ncbi:MAG: DUF5103 domain-containing protein [Sediminibacterium sp.]|nr:DUF5103 domain-containing protein [Sediminibacterium sp.]MBP6144425.1 DUF5103 domain-containing protein [Sediminibacterium sp.]
MTKWILPVCLYFFVLPLHGQVDKILDPNIQTVLVFPKGKPLALPVIGLNTQEELLIQFDDLAAQYQQYYFTIELMDIHWQPVALNPFDYIRGLTQNNIRDYTISSIAQQSYYHYSFSFPTASCRPTKSGNYLMKVYKQGRGNELVFTKRFFVIEQDVPIAASIQEPFDGTISKSHQKIQVALDVKKINFLQPERLQVAVLQNTRFNDLLISNAPSFIRGNQIEYNADRDFVFPAGKEARWLDLQNLRFKTDRIAQIQQLGTGTNIILKPDQSRTTIPYYTFKDLNGQFIISNSESIRNEDQNDYAHVLFTYLPKNGIPYQDKTLYLAGALTGNQLDSNARMQWNNAKGQYEKWLQLKQGYYSYNYILRADQSPNPMHDFMWTEGDHWETENSYTIFVYYRVAGSRYDQIIGFSSLNSIQNW